MKVESLDEWAKREKARWLRRVMYHPDVTPTEKCMAFAVADHLNCVTLDCWPAQSTLARLLGYGCTRTVQRAARGLERLGLITIAPNVVGKSEYRYAPIFLSEDKRVASGGQSGPHVADMQVKESSLTIRTRSDSTATRTATSQIPAFSRRQRGATEIKVAAMLGDDGLDVLCRLAAIDDALVTRLCRAAADGALGERDLAAARLAAKRV